MDLGPEAAKSIDTISIVRVPQEVEVRVQNLAHPGMVFGAIGGAIAAVDAQKKADSYKEALSSHKYSVANALTTAVEQRLVAAGYKVRIIDGVWEKGAGGLTLQTDKLAAEGPVLIIAPRVVGYVSTMTHDYLPTVWVVATLQGPGQKELYRGYHSTGWQPVTGDWKHTKHVREFKNFDELMAKAEESVSALTQGAEFVSQSIASDLRR